MSEKYVAEYLEIIDGYGERKGVCVTDTEHTVSFEVKDGYVAMELCDLLNKLSEEKEQLKKELDCIKKTNKLYGYNVECDYEWYKEIDKEE